MTTTSRAPAGVAWRQIARRAALVLVAALTAPNTADAQDKGTLNPQPLPPLAHPQKGPSRGIRRSEPIV